MVLLPLFLQNLLGYPATLSGMVMSPGGIGTLIFMPVAGYLIAKSDARYLVVFGLTTLSISMFMMSHWNLQIGFWDAVWPRVVTGVGLAFLFVPLSTLTVSFAPPEKIGVATGIFNLMRNLGGSFGIAFVTTTLAQRSQYHQSRLVEHVNQYNPAFQHVSQATTAHLQFAGQPHALAKQQAMGMMYSSVLRQASAMSFLDCFWLLGVAMIVLLPVIFIMRRPPKHDRPSGH